MTEQDKEPQAFEGFDDQPIIKPDFPTPPETDYAPLPDTVGKSYHRFGFKRILVVVIICAALLMTLFMIYNAKWSYYHRTMNGLGFDYRSRETAGIMQALSAEDSVSGKIAKDMKTRATMVSANQYYFDENEQLVNSVSHYKYKREGSTENLTLKTASSQSPFTETETMRFSSDKGYELYQGGDWQTNSEIAFQNLFAYFFAVESENAFIVRPYQTYETKVNGQTYQCEIWLLEENPDATAPRYRTLYRYYQSGSLKGVCVLDASTKILQVFDIESYSFDTAAFD